MKISVVYYSEHGDYSKPECVIERLKRYYKDNVHMYEHEWGRRLTSMLEDVDGEDTQIQYITTNSLNDRMTILENVRKEEPDLLVTFNLAGFENVTLTDTYSYNLIIIPQIHFCTKAEAEKMDKVLAINMFMAQL